MKKVYPAYFLSIIIGFIVYRAALIKQWHSLPAQFLLIFNWYPNDKCGSETWFCQQGINEPAWYLGALQVYWFLFPHLYKIVRQLSQTRVAALLAICWSLCLVWPILLGFISTPKEGSQLRTFQEFSPVNHFHKFVFGMCVARLFVDLFCRAASVDRPDTKFVSDFVVSRTPEVNFFTPVSLVVLAFLFFSVPYNSFSLFYLSAQEFVLLPLFSMLVVGVSLQADCISRFLTRWPLNVVEKYDISYEVYILQGCVFQLTIAVMRSSKIEAFWEDAIATSLLIVASLIVKQFIKWP